MCTTHADAGAHTSGQAKESRSGHCGHCSHDELTLEELRGRRDQIDRDIAARELDGADADERHHTA